MFIDEADQFSLLNVEKAHRDMVGGVLTFGEFLVASCSDRWDGR